MTSAPSFDLQAWKAAELAEERRLYPSTNPTDIVQDGDGVWWFTDEQYYWRHPGAGLAFTKTLPTKEPP